MSDFDRNPAAAHGYPADRAVAIDQGLRAHMIRVYNYMAGGVALTGAIAWITFQFSVVTNEAGAIVALTPLGQTLFQGPMLWVLDPRPARSRFLLEFSDQPPRGRHRPRLVLPLDAGLLGVSLATIFMVYTHGSIARVFFIWPPRSAR